MVSVGETAPDFIAPAAVGDEATELGLFGLVEAHDAVVLLLFPVDFVPAPTAELVTVERAGWSNRSDVAVIGISADSLFAHAAYADRYDLSMPLVSDWHGGVADSYGLRREEFDTHTDVPERAAVVVDGEWTVRGVIRADPLARASPAPVEKAAERLREAGIDVAQPTVDYDAV